MGLQVIPNLQEWNRTEGPISYFVIFMMERLKINGLSDQQKISYEEKNTIGLVFYVSVTLQHARATGNEAQMFSHSKVIIAVSHSHISHKPQQH